MSLVGLMPMHDNTGRVWPATSNSAWPEESRLLSATSAPFTPHSQFQRSAVLSWSQFNDWAEISDGRVASLATEDSAAAHSHNAVRASVTPDAQSFAGTSKAPGVQPDEAILDFLDMDLLEELSKGSLSTNTTTELKIPDPIIAFRRDPPLLIAPSLPPHMPAADQERAKACWDSMRSISDPAGGFSPALEAAELSRPMTSGAASGSRSGSSSRERQSKAAATRKRASPHSRASPENKTPRDEAARARNARNQQLHRQRQREKLEVSEGKRAELEERLKHLTLVNAGLRAHNQLLEASEQGHPESLDEDALWGAAKSAATTGAHQKLAALFTCVSLGMGKGAVSAAEVALMSPEDVFLFRQQYGAYLSHLFQCGVQNEGSAAHAQLLQLVALWGDCEAHLWEHCPRALQRMAAMAQRQDDDGLCLPFTLKWQSILAQLGLSSGQRAALKQVHRRLVDQLLNVTAERFHVSAMLKEVCPDPEAGNTWEGSRTFLRVREASKRLQASIRSEHTLMRDAHAAFRQVVSPLQQAMCDMLAHPGSLDIIALLSLLRAGL